MKQAKRPKTEKPLLQWMERGDPELVPVMMSGAHSTAASYYGVPERKRSAHVSFTGVQESEITPDMIIKCSRDTGLRFKISLGQPTVFDAVEFTDGIEMTVRKETGPSGVNLRFTSIRTPDGELSEVFRTPPDAPGMWDTHLVKSEKDLPAFAFLVEHAARAVVEDGRIRAKVTAGLRAEAEKWPADTPFYVVLGVPAFELMCNLFMGAAESVYLLADHTALMERLFEVQGQALAVWVECAAEAGADFVCGAINGLELFSPAVYERYFVPEARALNDMVRASGMRSWLHTCGHMRRLIDMGIYDQMGYDVIESLSSPPLGDVADLRQARRRLGHGVVTRGALNVDLFYDTDLGRVRQRTAEVLEQTRGYRHMPGDTNDSYPPYPRDNILAVTDEVRKSGRMW